MPLPVPLPEGVALSEAVALRLMEGEPSITSCINCYANDSHPLLLLLQQLWNVMLQLLRAEARARLVRRNSMIVF